MGRKRRWLIAVLGTAAVVAIAGYSGAGGRDYREKGFAEKESPVSLTERQKKLLRDRNLPESWEDLTAVQKESIRTIEELMQYLENKYDRTFVFAEYRPPSVLEPDTAVLLFRDEEETAGRRAASVRRRKTESGVICTDNYPAVASEKILEKLLETWIREQTGSPCKVFAFVRGSTLTMPPETPEELTGAIRADACIWMSEKDVREKALPEIADVLSRKLQDRKIPGRCQLMLVTESAWDAISRTDYARFFSEKYCLWRETIRTDG